MSLPREASVPLTADAERDLTALRRAIARAGGFALYIVVCDGPARAELVRRLRGWSGTGGIPPLHFFPVGREASASVDRFLAGGGPPPPLSGVVLADGDTLVKDEASVQALNAARDRLGELVTGPLLLIVSPRRGAELAREAPDLFDVRMATYEVEAMPMAAGALPAPALPLAQDEKLAPADRALPPDPEALRHLEASGSPPPASALADAWLRVAAVRRSEEDLPDAAAAATEALRLSQIVGYQQGAARALRFVADAHERAGAVLEAERMRRQSIERYREAHDDRGGTDARYELASVLIRSGRLDEARSILEEALSIYEKLGDVRSRAVTMGRIADILEARGQLDEALRIRNEEQLPVYEKLGDVRSRAVTMGKIADILSARGQLDEALRIRNEKELPVFEKLGAARDLLVARTKIALIYLARAQPGDREAAAELLRLAHTAAAALALPEAAQIRLLQQRHALVSATEPPPDP